MECRKHLPTLAPENRLRNPRVLSPDLTFIFLKALPGSAQDGQIDVNNEHLVPAFGKYRVTCGQDEVFDPCNAICRYPRLLQFPGSPLRTLSLVIACPDVIGGVVEPKSHFHFRRLLCKGQMLTKQGHAFGQVLDRVVLPLWLTIGGNQALH